MGNKTSVNRKDQRRFKSMSSVQIPVIKYTVKGVSIEVLQGDITDESTDAIVNATDSRFSFSSPLSQAILKRGGQSMQNDCITRVGTLTHKGVITSAGTNKLLCKYVLHVLSPNSLEECESVTSGIIVMARNKLLKSISLPFIGAEALWSWSDRVASIITDSIVSSANDGYCYRLKWVRLVGNSADERRALDNAMKRSVNAIHVKLKSQQFVDSLSEISTPNIQQKGMGSNGSAISGGFTSVNHADGLLSGSIRASESVMNSRLPKHGAPLPLVTGRAALPVAPSTQAQVYQPKAVKANEQIRIAGRVRSVLEYSPSMDRERQKKLMCAPKLPILASERPIPPKKS